MPIQWIVSTINFAWRKKVVLMELCIMYNEDLYNWINYFIETEYNDVHGIFKWVVTVEYLTKWGTTCN